MSDSINQTEFTEGTHVNVVAPAVTPVEAPVPVKKKSMVPIIAGVICLVIVVLGCLSYYTYVNRTQPKVKATPMPTPTDVPIETKAIQAEIAPYLKVIEDSNPEKDEHPFPPVNFELRIKDPNSR